jgi:hypothetical protein
MGARPGAAMSGPNERSAAGPLDVNCARRPLAAGTSTRTCEEQAAARRMRNGHYGDDDPAAVFI